MRNDRLHLIAAGFFACAFVLAGSGWSAVLSTLMNQRPEWSVCGQDMCSCVKPTDDQPACPLCKAGLMDPADMLADESCGSGTDTPVRRVPKNNDSLDALGNAGSTAAVALFVGTMLASNQQTSVDADTRIVMMVNNDRVPRSRSLDCPLAPPRA